MKEATRIQIENMKNDYIFGVEVEMNHITRRKAAQIAAEFFGTGLHEYTAGRNGYQSYSAWDAEGREWRFAKDVSIFGPDEEKTELISPVLEWKDIPLLQELLRQLRHRGAISNPANGCGIHCHVSHKGGFTVRDLTNLVCIMAAHEEEIGRAIKIDEGRVGRYCHTVDPDFLKRIKARKPRTMKQLEDSWYKGSGGNYGRQSHYHPSRYAMLNMHSFFQGHGVEFRLFQFQNPHDGKRGGLNGGEIKTFIQLSIAMCELARQVKFASPKAQVTDNPKYHLRCWLLRLGFIGDEFKTARTILLRNLEGSSAFRHGSPAA